MKNIFFFFTFCLFLYISVLFLLPRWKKNRFVGGDTRTARLINSILSSLIRSRPFTWVWPKIPWNIQITSTPLVHPSLVLPWRSSNLCLKMKWVKSSAPRRVLHANSTLCQHGCLRSACLLCSPSPRSSTTSLKSSEFKANIKNIFEMCMICKC